MSQTRKFKIGNAEIFQDKPSEETRRALELMHKTQEENLYKLSEGYKYSTIEETINAIAEKLSNFDESVVSAFVSVLIRKTKKLKQQK